MSEREAVASMLTKAMVDNDFGRIRITFGSVSISVRPTRFYADKENPSISGIKVHGASLMRPGLDSLAGRIIDIAYDYGVDDVISALPDHIELCGAYKTHDRKWNPEGETAMKITNNSKAMDKISTNVTTQKHMERVERELMEFVKKHPITIEYGCHTIELREDDRQFNGFSFHAIKDDGKGIVIDIN